MRFGLLIFLIIVLQSVSFAYFSSTAGKETYFYHDLYFPSWRFWGESKFNLSVNFAFEKAVKQDSSVYLSLTGVGTAWYVVGFPAANQVKAYYKRMLRENLSGVIGATVTSSQSLSASFDAGLAWGRDINNWMKFYAPLILSFYGDGMIIRYGAGFRNFLFGSRFGLDIGLKGARLFTYDGSRSVNDYNFILGAGYNF